MVLLEKLPFYQDIDINMTQLLMGLPLKYSGLDVPEPKRTYGGKKIKQEFLIPEELWDNSATEEVAVTIDFEDTIINGEVTSIKKTLKIYNQDGTVFCSKVDNEIVRSYENLKKSRYSAAYTYLRQGAKGTAIETHVNAILSYFLKEVNIWLLGDFEPFKTAVTDFTSADDTTINAYLEIVIAPPSTEYPDGMKVRDSILLQLI